MYIKLKLINPGAKHIVCAYWLADLPEPYGCDYQDDGEPGAGRAILKWMKENQLENRVFFAVRFYASKIDSTRFDCYMDVVRNVIEKDPINFLSKKNQSPEQQTGRKQTFAKQVAKSQQRQRPPQNQQIVTGPRLAAPYHPRMLNRPQMQMRGYQGHRYPATQIPICQQYLNNMRLNYNHNLGRGPPPRPHMQQPISNPRFRPAVPDNTSVNMQLPHMQFDFSNPIEKDDHDWCEDNQGQWANDSQENVD